MLQKAVDDSATGHAKIQDGDLVIVYERHDKMKPVYVKNGENYQNRFGTFFHREWIGIPFGSKVRAGVLKTSAYPTIYFSI
eukprot:3342500-Pyramimonas_sp.AAC.1